MIIQKCKVCGKEFETVNPRYTICSEECRIINNKANHQVYAAKNYNAILKQNRERRWKNPKTIRCKICGENVPPVYTEERMIRKHYHEDCIIREAVKAYKNGARFYGNSKILTVARNQGITKDELIEIIENEGV